MFPPPAPLDRRFTRRPVLPLERPVIFTPMSAGSEAVLQQLRLDAERHTLTHPRAQGWRGAGRRLG